MLGLALLALGYTGGLVWFTATYPTDGCSLHLGPTGAVVTMIHAGPLQAGDLIVEVGGRPLNVDFLRPGSWYHWFFDPPPSDVAYTVVRGDETLGVAVRWYSPPLATVLSGYWALLFIGIVFILMAALLLLSQARDPAAPWLALFFGAEGFNLVNNAWMAAGVNLALSGAWLFHPLDLLSFAITFSAAFHALLLFPERSLLLRSRPWLPYLVHALNLMVALAGVVGMLFWPPLEVRTLTYRFLYPLAGMELLYGLGHLIRVYRRSRQPGVRNQIRWVMWGVIIGASPWLLLYNLPVVLGYAPLLPLEILVLPLALVPGSFFVAVTRWNLMAVDTLIQRSLLYTALVALLLGFYVVGTTVLGVLIQWSLGRTAPQLVALLAIAVVALVANPLRLYLQQWINRLFFRHWAGSERVLREVGSRLTTTLRLEVLVPLLVEELPTRLQLTGAALLQRQPDGTFASPDKAFTLTVAADDPLFQVIKRGEVLILGAARNPAPAVSRLAEQGWELVLPLYAGGQWVGLYLLGPHLSGDLYRRPEIEMLQTLAYQIAATLENARLYSEIAQHSASLEVLVAERTRELAIANQLLLSERDRLNVILQNMVDGLLVADLTGQMLLVNPALEAIVHKAARRLIGQPVTGLDIPALNTLLAQASERPGQVLTGDVTLGERAFRVTVIALGDRSGTITVLRDVTHEREVDRMKTEFVSTVSHELRTPLTSVLGFAKLISRTMEREVLPYIPADNGRVQRSVQRVRENLEIIVGEGERLTRLINDVLDIAKMEAGRIEWRDQPLDLATVIRQAVQNVQAMAIGKQLTLTVQLDEIGVPVVADPDRILQVIANLLSNAIKFTDHGTVTVTARPLAAGEEVHGWRAPLPHHSGGAAEGPGGVLVTVQDTGVGIPAEALPRLFQRFQQIGDTLRDKPKGTGLGLAISREIVTHYGGAIWAESEVGVGSLFCFTLPLMPTTPATPLKSPVQPETTGRSPVDPQSCTLLVVDDDGAIRALLRQTLSEVGYQVLEAADGAVAIAEARRSRPDLLILDVRMPGLSGFDVIQVLKSDPNTVQIPILILSVEAQQRSLELGAAAQLTKPVDPELLLKTVARLLQIGRAAEQPARWQESA